MNRPTESPIDLYGKLATRHDARSTTLAGRGTETREDPETVDEDLALMVAMAPGIPQR